MKISVLTICYNAESCIEQTIQSVISQQYDDFEYIVVDGSSNDGTVDIIRKYSAKISRWVSEPDSGIYNAMNKAAGMAGGDYCIFMNAGDMFASPLVLRQVSTFLDYGFNIVTGNELSVKDGKVINYVHPHRELTLQALYEGSVSHQSTFVSRQLLLDNPYDETLKMVSDWKFWLQMLVEKKAKYKSIDVDVCFFGHEGVTFTNRECGREERQRVLRELLTPAQIEECKANVHRKDLQGLLFRTKRYLIRNYYVAKLSKKWQKECVEFRNMAQVIGGGKTFILRIFHYLAKYGKATRTYSLYHKALMKESACPYLHIVLENKNKECFPVTEYSNTIWLCWWQGEKNMPWMVQECVKTIRKHAGDAAVRIVTFDNYRDYVDIPEYITNLVKDKKVSLTHFADILRFTLLATHGGLWMDVSNLVLGDINLSDYLQKDFFTVRQGCADDGRFVSHYQWATYLIGGKQPNRLFVDMRDLLFAYLKDHQYFAEYFLIDYLLRLIVDNDETCAELVRQVPVTNPQNLKLSGILNEPEDEKRIHELLSDTGIFKLIYQRRLITHDDSGKETNLGFILRNYL